MIRVLSLIGNEVQVIRNVSFKMAGTLGHWDRHSLLTFSFRLNYFKSIVILYSYAWSLIRRQNLTPYWIRTYDFRILRPVLYPYT